MTDRAIHYLIHRVAARIGYRAEAIPFATAVQALRQRYPRGFSSEELARRVQNGDEDLERALLESVSVGETFFFRQPEHFRYLAETFIPRFNGSLMRAWSAGCATGEEPYSIAACLLATVPSAVKVEVLGTDITERNVIAARRGIYGPWSIRDGGPILFPTFGPSERGAFVVSDEVRTVTRFAPHNILEDPPAPGQFDIIFCRNVLLYFSAEAGYEAMLRLVEALAPGGVLIFGTLDVGRTPPGTDPVQPREANIFIRKEGRRTRMPRRPSVRASRPPPAAAPALDVTIPKAPSVPVMAHGATAAAAQTKGVSTTKTDGRVTQKPPGPAAAAQRGVTTKTSNKSLRPHTNGRRSKAPEFALAVPSEEVWIAEHLYALAAIEQNDFTRAEALLKALRSRAPRYLPGLFELGVLVARSGQRRDAEAIMRDLLRQTEGRDAHDPVPGPEELTIAYYRVAAEAYLGFTPGQRSKL
jgi:chemotaxis methyl-accepting protein methylase